MEARLAGVFLAIVGLFLALSYMPYQIDDSYITYRYAENLIHGYGFVFNQGGESVEGFSSPVWLFLLTLFGLAFGIHTLPAISVTLGIFSYFSSAYVLYHISINVALEKNRAAKIFGLVTPLLYLCMPSANFYAVVGLETPAFTLLVVVFTAALSGLIPRWCGIAAAIVATWLRPETPWLLFTMIVHVFFYHNEWQKHFLTYQRCSIALILSYIGLLCWRYSLFHEWLPNTYFAKKPDPTSGLNYLINAIHEPWIIILFLTAFCGAWSGTKEHRFFFCIGMSWVLAAYLEGGDWMENYRFLLPAFTFACLAGHGNIYSVVANTIKITSVSLRKKLQHYAMIFGLIATALVEVQYSRLSAYKIMKTLFITRHEMNILNNWIRLSEANSVAMIDIGIIGYQYPLSIVDLAGLTDAYIAHSNGTLMNKQFNLDYLFIQNQPDLIVIRLDKKPESSTQNILYSPALADAGYSPIEKRILSDLRLKKQYFPLFVLLPRFQGRYPLYAQVVFVRHGFKPSAQADLDTEELVVDPLPLDSCPRGLEYFCDRF